MRKFNVDAALQLETQRKKHSVSARRKMTQAREAKRQANISTIKQYLPDVKTVLCVGCRDDSEVLSFQDAGFEAVGLDIANETSLITRGDAHNLSDNFQTPSFDLIYATDCMEHMYEPSLVLSQFKQCAKMGVFIDLPTYTDAAKADANHCSIFDIMEYDRASGVTLESLSNEHSNLMDDFISLGVCDLVYFKHDPDAHDGAGLAKFLFKLGV